jgi:hypothetical protein
MKITVPVVRCMSVNWIADRQLKKIKILTFVFVQTLVIWYVAFVHAPLTIKVLAYCLWPSFLLPKM